MRLLDQVVQETQPITLESPRAGRLTLPGANALSATVKNANLKYILQDDVVSSINILVFKQPKLIYSCLDLIRVPSESLWIEWRAIIGDATEQITNGAIASTRKTGVLVHSEPCGRRGTIQVVWEGESGKPEPSPALIIFDLDEKVRGTSTQLTFAISNNSFNLKEIMEHCVLEVQPDWLKYYQTVARHGMDKLYSDLGAAIIFDAPFIFGFFLILASRSQITYQASDLKRLNVQRAKAKKPSLMDYIEIGTVLHGVDRSENSMSHGDTRSASRLHHVRGHFVRRANQLFWRSPHLRGDADVGTMPGRIRRVSL